MIEMTTTIAIITRKLSYNNTIQRKPIITTIIFFNLNKFLIDYYRLLIIY